MTTIRSILCPVDTSERSRRAMGFALDVGAQFGAQVTFGRLAEPAGAGAADAARFEGELGRLVELARGRGVSTRTVVLRGDAFTEIVGLSESLDPDLVVLGSPDERILHRVRRPVVTVATSGPRPAPGSTIGTILCAESLSKDSRALDCALGLARQSHAHLAVLHALEELPPEAALGSPPFEYGPSLMACAAERLWAMVPSAERDRDRIDVVVTPGRACEQILLAATRLRPDVIVMGVHARTPVDFVYWGSTARHVVRHAECPVLTVHGGVGPAWAQTSASAPDTRPDL